MSKILELPDDVYDRLEKTAEASGVTASEWVRRHLGASDDKMQMMLNDYVAWTESVGRRWQGSV